MFEADCYLGGKVEYMLFQEELRIIYALDGAESCVSDSMDDVVVCVVGEEVQRGISTGREVEGKMRTAVLVTVAE